jgi:peroxiredoxin Q/BCP
MHSITVEKNTMQNESPLDFEVATTGGKTFKLIDYIGRGLVIYFYPKDDTSGCTTEGQDFSALYAQFQALGWEVFGVSRDSLSSHEKFKAKYNFPFELLADVDELACDLFGVIKLKNMFGKQVRGIERSTFIMTPAGQLIRSWRGVKVPNHAQEVLDYVRSLSSAGEENPHAA